MSGAVQIMLLGSFVAAACALVGSFLMLRRLSMLGDAISHAVLPGIVLAFMLTGGARNSWLMLLGAAAFGLLTVWLVELLQHSRLLAIDAALGVVFPVLFALGVVLVSRFTGSVHLDVDCVLYGEIAYAPLDPWVVFGQSLGARGMWQAGAVLLLLSTLLVLFYRPLEVSTFDPQLAITLGISQLLVHGGLMALVSLTVVVSFEAVGAILVVAMLVVPPATAYLLTDRLKKMLLLAVIAGVLSAVLGYLAASAADVSIAGAMACVAGAQFLLAMVVSPKHGVLSWLLARRRQKRALEARLVLRWLERHGAQPASDQAAAIAASLGWSSHRVSRVLAAVSQQPR
jgi:manganese/zinc/iron transport system permease protein